jgi:hypothetical protein
MPIRHNGTESVQVEIFLPPLHMSTAICHYIGMCKKQACEKMGGIAGLLMVKVIVMRECGMGSCTRYPYYPRQRRPGTHRATGFLHKQLRAVEECVLELTGTLEGVVRACSQMVCELWRQHGVVPQRVASRVGASMATYAARVALVHPLVQKYYFFNGRWPGLQIQGSALARRCAHICILEHMDFRDCSMLHKTLVRKCGHRASSLILEFVSVNSCLNMLQHTPLVRVLAQALYVLIVHARMFNHIFTDHVHALFSRRSSGMLRDVSALLLRHPCLDVWAENVFRSGEWRTRPMVVRR